MVGPSPPLFLERTCKTLVWGTIFSREHHPEFYLLSFFFFLRSERGKGVGDGYLRWPTREVNG